MIQKTSLIKRTKPSLITLNRNKKKYNQTASMRVLSLTILLFIGIAIASVGCSKRSDQDVPKQIEQLLQKAKKARKEGQEFSSIVKFYRAAFELKREEMKEREVHAGKNSGIGPCTLLEYEGFVHNYEQFANAASSLSNAIYYAARESSDEELRLKAARYLYSAGQIEISHALLSNVALRLHKKACLSMETWRAVSDAAKNMDRKDLAGFIDEYLHDGDNKTSSSSPEKAEKSEHQKRAEQIFESSSLLKLLTDKPDDGPRYTSVLKKLLTQATTKENLPNGFLQKTMASLQPSGCLGPAEKQKRHSPDQKTLLEDLQSFRGNVPVGNSPFVLPETGTLVTIGLDVIAVNGKTTVEKTNNEIPEEAFREGKGGFFITPLFDSLEKEARALKELTKYKRNRSWDMLVIIADKQVKARELMPIVFTASQAELTKSVLVVKNKKGEYRVIPLLHFNVGINTGNCSQVFPRKFHLPGFVPNPSNFVNSSLEEIAKVAKNTPFTINHIHYLNRDILRRVRVLYAPIRFNNQYQKRYEYMKSITCDFDFVMNYLQHGQQSIQCSFSINNKGTLGNLVVEGTSPPFESLCLRRWIHDWNVDGSLEGSYRFAFSFPPRKGIPKTGQLSSIDPGNPNWPLEKLSKTEKNDAVSQGPVYVKRDEDVEVSVFPGLTNCTLSTCKNDENCKKVENVKASKVVLQSLFKELMKPENFFFNDYHINVLYEGNTEISDIVSAVNIINDAYRNSLGTKKIFIHSGTCHWKFSPKFITFSNEHRVKTISTIRSLCLYPNIVFKDLVLP